MSQYSAWLAAAVLAALTLVGCSAPGDSPLTPPGGGAGSSAQSSADDQPDPDESPLQQYRLASVKALLDRSGQPQDPEQGRLVEESIAACMTAEGFEYVPKLASTPAVAPGDDEADLWRPDDRAWVERYGYGVTNNPYSDRAASVPEPVDPNQTYLDSLTDAEREAYYEALMGRTKQADDEEDVSAPALQERGCVGRAEYEVRGARPTLQKEDREILAAIQAFDDELRLQPEFDAIDAAWAQCMTTAGFEGFTRQLDAAESIYQLDGEYWQGRSPRDHPDLGTTRDPDFVAIGERELTLALADLTCREATDYRTQQLAIQFAMEKQFVADHAEEVAALASRLDPGR